MSYENLGQLFRCGQCHKEFPQPGEPLDIPSEEVFNALIAHSKLPVVVDFWAPWCGPCRRVGPEIAKVAAETAGQWVIAKLNTDELQGLAERFNITGIPTLMVFHGGKEVAKQSGAMPAAGIRQFVQSSLVPRS
jgi:thioredoxin 2